MLREEVAAIPHAGNSHWGRNAERLRAHIENRDPAHFLRWGIVTDAMWASGAYIDKELGDLKAREDWPRYELALQETWRGDPEPWQTMPETCGNLIHQARHIAHFEDTTGMEVYRLNGIWEFGGGYGAMARMFRALGFAGEYVIYDLPMMGALQRYYLDGLGVTTTTDLSVQPQHKDLFVAMWSLSEAPMSLRDRVKPLAMEYATHLIAYQFGFEGVNNEDYFGAWMSAGHWAQERIAHLPPTSTYLVGAL